MTTELLSQVAAAMIANPALEDEALVVLIEPLTGGDTEQAWLLVELLPLAFGTILLKRAGAINPQEFSRRLVGGGWSVSLPLKLLPLWEPCVEFARQQAAASLPEQDFQAIAGRGWMMDLINNSKKAGASLKGSILSFTSFFRPVAAADLPLPPPKPPWWKFW